MTNHKPNSLPGTVHPRMTPARYRAIQRSLGLAGYEMGRLLGMHDRTASQYRSGSYPIPRPVALALESFWELTPPQREGVLARLKEQEDAK